LNAAVASASPAPLSLVVRWLGRVPYEPTWRAMQQFTQLRTAATDDELWLLEHEPVYTLGMNADAAHVLDAGDIPVIRIDRGGQVTYHGPGQLVIYPLIDLRRAHLGVRDLVTALEVTAIDLAARHGIRAACRANAPGVYVDEAKFASVGLRVRRGGSYHGLAINVNMDLAPFARINPCGYAGLAMTQLATLGGPRDVRQVADEFAPLLAQRLALRACAGTGASLVSAS